MWLTFGCQGMRRIGECRKFVGVANAALVELQEVNKTNTLAPNADAYATLAERFKLLDQQVEQLGVSDPTLLQAVGDYRATLKETAAQAEIYANELRQHPQTSAPSEGAAGGSGPGDPETRPKATKPRTKAEQETARALSRSRTAMGKVLRSHKANVARIDALCQPK